MVSWALCTLQEAVLSGPVAHQPETTASAPSHSLVALNKEEGTPASLLIMTFSGPGVGWACIGVGFWILRSARLGTFLFASSARKGPR